jgi:hypothetical protein
MKIVTLIFEISIQADAAKVWHSLWNLENYKAWTSVFCAGSYYKTDDFKKGNKIHLLTPNGDGMYSILHDVQENKFLAFKHLGDLKNHNEMPIEGDVLAWSGALETYTLNQNGNTTDLIVHVDTIDTYIDFMNKSFPLALQELKKIAEAN